MLSLGATNSASIVQAIRRAGGDSYLIERSQQLTDVESLVIPGVANVRFLLSALDERSLRIPILRVIDGGIPVLGICAGFQALFHRSDEAPLVKGLGVFDGVVIQLRGPKSPHTGWNWVESVCSSIECGWAYFAHSFAPPAQSPQTIATTEHGVLFTSIARRGNVLGVQFHPERSGRYGAQFLENFIAMCTG